MIILNDNQIKQKVKRLSYEIIEQNTGVKDLYFAGINNKGHAFAELLINEIKKINEPAPATHLFRLKLNPAAPTQFPVTIDIDEKKLARQRVILVDDVANTGRTLFYAFRPFMPLLLKKIQVAVLVDRKHKSFPILVDFVGLSLATTINDHIEVNLSQSDAWSVEVQ